MKKIKLDIQKFGGRGASSGTSTIKGSPIVKNTNGYHFWPIGKNAPSGYIGLIKGSGTSASTAYIKSNYANEVANFGSAGSVAMNYEKISTLNNQIAKKEVRIQKLKAQNVSENKIQYEEKQLKEMKRAKEIRQKLGL